MKDDRVKAFRKALEGLMESLDATVRVSRWDAEESVPEPLAESAGNLVVRLGAAGRLAAGTFRGSPVDVARVNAMCGAMRRLDTAYVAYRKTTPREPDVAAMALHHEIDEVRAEAQAWG